MKRTIPFLLIILLLLFVSLTNGCSGSARWDLDDYPSYPYDPGGSYGGEYDWDDDYPGEGIYWTDNMLGEWEGFLWEDYRSDNIPLSKRYLAMRCYYDYTEFTWSERLEWIEIDLLIDGRPAVSKLVSVDSDNRLDFRARRDDIDLYFSGYFYTKRATGDIDLEWDEKIKLPGSNKTQKHHVHLAGEFELYRVKDPHWGAAWVLFDEYGDSVWDLPDEAWESATRSGIEYLKSLDITELRKREEAVQSQKLPDSIQ